MYISPKIAIDEGWVTYPTWMNDEQKAKCIQPNALDFTIDHLRALEAVSPCFIGENEKTMRKTVQVIAEMSSGVGLSWKLHGHMLYDFMSDFYVDLPEGVAVEVIARSTFVRNGLFITTGLWDSGFKGPIGGIIHCGLGEKAISHIEQHVRVGQLKFVQTDKGGTYAGGYNTDPGVHWQTTLTKTTKVNS